MHRDIFRRADEIEDISEVPGPVMPKVLTEPPPDEPIPDLRPVDEKDIYFFYHASVPMYQMGGEHWKKWNRIMKPVMLESQEKNGSWPAVRCYRSKTMATALGAMTLEVYYRYLRIYE
jgi:hypothetical protein